MAKKIAVTKKAITESLYYITNQYNLREILAGGFIGSRASFDDKYYDDLLVESPGRIPLFTSPLEPSLFQQVNAHDPETSFAVALQIDPAQIASYSYDEINAGEKDGHQRLACIAYAGVISLKNVSAIHFLSAENRSEFEVRLYSNMPNPRELYKVSPELAQTPGHTPNILQILKAVPPLTYPTPDQFSSEDRVSGAISLCIYKSEGKEQDNQLLKLLEPRKKQHKSPDKLPAWFALGLEKKTSEEIYRLTDINELVFAGTISVLYAYNLNSISRREKILEQIKELIYSHPAIAEFKETLERSFVKIERVLQLKDDFEPFKSSVAGYDAIRALLLFLMRPHHKELLSRNISETNAGQPVILTALAYSGIVIGRKGLDMEYRPADAKIAELTIAALNGLAEQNKNLTQTPPKTLKGKTPKSSTAAITTKSGVAVPVQLKEASPTDWSIINSDVLDEKKDDPEFMRSAVELCRKKDWKDCVKTVVNWSVKDSFSMQSGQKNELSIRLTGFPEIFYELDFEQFKLNLLKLEILD